MKWIKVSDQLPPVDTKDEWSFENDISERLLTASDFGIRFGSCYMLGEPHWSVEGVTSQKAINVTHWMKVETPKEQQDKLRQVPQS